MTEKEKMMAGMWYDANYNQELTELRFKTQELLLKFNQTPLSHQDEIHDLYKELFGTDPWFKYFLWRECLCECIMLFHGWSEDYNWS